MIHKYFRVVLIFTFLLALVSFTKAQCDINTFTLTPTNGTCAQDTKVNVAVPGGATCGSAIATIRLQGTTTDLDFKPLSAAGNATFDNLKPGTYEVRIQQAATTTVYKTVSTTTTYKPIVVTTTSENTTCGNTDPLFTNNGKATVSFSGGNGPYTITLAGPGGPYIFNSPTATTHAFTNLAPGNYTATVTDNSATCTSAEARSVTISQSSWVPLSYTTARRLVNESCQIYFRFEVNNGNRDTVWLPGNATYKIAGDPTVYQMTFTSKPSTGRYFLDSQMNLPLNTDITYTITDGCRVLTGTVNSGKIGDYWEQRNLKKTYNDSCNPVFSFSYRTWNDTSDPSAYYWHFSKGVKASFYAEVPVMSNNWVFIEDRSITAYYESFAWNEFQTTYLDTRVKVVFTDANGCNNYEKIVDGRNLTFDNNLNKVVLGEISGVLEGTSTISVDKVGGPNWSGTDSFSYPITFNIARKDGQTNMTINPQQPYSLAGTYTMKFPYVRTLTTSNPSYWGNDKPIFGDLPLGEYVVTITDGCGYTVTREINLTKPAGYSPTLKDDVGCAASNVVYDMGVNANTQKYGRVRVYENNNGVRGNIVGTFNPNLLLNGQFPNIHPGNYFLVFSEVNYYDRIVTTLPYDSPASNISVARNITGVDQEYYVPFTVRPYQQMSFNTVSLFCNPSDTNSGILGIEASGIPVGFINYGVWAQGADPETATPLYTYNTTNLTQMSHVFTGLSAGTYIVRVTNQCGFTEQTVIVQPGTLTFPDPVGVPEKICNPGEDVNLAIALPSSLFDIVWKDQATGTTVGTGSSIIVKPMVTSNYKVEYSLKSSFGCSGSYTGSGTITVEVGNCFCYKPATTSGTTLDTKHGITALSRAGAQGDNWPMVRKGAWTALESHTKGFVINRIATTAQVEAIGSPIEGMMVYDEEADCLKIYTSSDNGVNFAWKCFKVQGCPD